jgi:activating signal cointegrator complex subunit 1
MMSSTSSGTKRQSQRPKRDFPSTHGNQRSRTPKHPNNSKARPTHFLALPIGHHGELRNAVSALTSSWLAHDPPIEGLDPTIVINPRRLHLTLGVMTLASSQPSQSNHDRDRDRETTIDLAGATTLLDSLAPRIRAVLANDPLRIPLGRLAIMQPDPARAHVLYVDPDVRSPDGRRLRAVCGTFNSPPFLVFLFVFFFFSGCLLSSYSTLPWAHVWRKPDWI